MCEGRACNPGLHEYDQISAQYGAFGGGKFAHDYVQERARELKHTPHELVVGERFVERRGWVKKYRCTVCGHTRLF